MLRLEEHLEMSPDDCRKWIFEQGGGWKARGKRYGNSALVAGGTTDGAAAYRYIYDYFRMYIIDRR